MIVRLAMLAVLSVGALACGQAQAQQPQRAAVPKFQPEPFWPKPLPGNWILGQVSGIAVDRNDHIWIVHRQGSLEAKEQYATMKPVASECCAAAPPVLEFNEAGDIVGIPNHGTLRIGDTLTEGEDLVFRGVPSFAPEILRRVRLQDAMKALSEAMKGIPLLPELFHPDRWLLWFGVLFVGKKKSCLSGFDGLGQIKGRSEV